MNKNIYAWINKGLIKAEGQQQALAIADERPNRRGWLVFIQRALVMLGSLSLAFGVIFFFAYNWNEMTRMVKFGLVQAALLGVFLLYCLKAHSNWVAQALLLVATLLVGALLALFGQTYQTGADPWQLFATWALLISPLVLCARSEVLWVVLAVLLNVALALYIQINQSLFGLLFFGSEAVWLFLLLNMALVLMTECLYEQPMAGLRQLRLAERWPAQLSGLGVLLALTIIGMEGIWGDTNVRALHLMMYVLMMAGGFAFYRYWRKDLLLLTAWAWAVMVFVMSFLGHHLFRHLDASGFLLMAMALIGMSAFAVQWIKGLHQAFNREALQRGEPS